MYALSARLTFHLHHSNSLKDKRQVRRSLIEKTKNRFNASIAEVDTQDTHRTLTIGIALVSGDIAYAQKALDEIIRYMEEHVDGELLDAEVRGI